ncbi:WXG100 family type VII secretion target [Mycolicibacterium setense]|uniref:WXG100 family type VII secretion target n=1 Tax=Mycolicibacterium setense TaxID=431269 RepID=UPI0009E24273|nr:WXG100 family type VII secretion target [Mycolicibacterium setense]
MGGSVEVVVSELNLAATRLEAAGQRLQDGLSSVDLETQQLLGSGWKGDAASAFGKAWEQWNGGAGQVVRGLQTMAQLLTVAGKEYAKTDQQSAGAIGSSGQATDGSGNDAPGAPAVPTTSGSPSASGAPSPAGGEVAELAQQIPELAQQMVAPVAGLGQVFGQLAQGLAQAGQMAAQIATQAAQQSGQGQPGAAEGDATKDDDSDEEHRKEHKDEKSGESEEASAEKRAEESEQGNDEAASGEQSTLRAPVQTPAGDPSGSESPSPPDGPAAERSDV